MPSTNKMHPKIMANMNSSFFNQSIDLKKKIIPRQIAAKVKFTNCNILFTVLTSLFFSKISIRADFLEEN